MKGILSGMWGSGAGTETDTDASRSLRISAVFQEDRLCPSFSPLENVMMVQKKTYF